MATPRRGRHQAKTIDELAATHHVSMTWAQRLKRVFNIAIESCEQCSGAGKVIASIEDPAAIKKILKHLDRRAQATPPAFKPFARAPPPAPLPGLTAPG